MGAHPRVLSESYTMNTNMTGLDGFQDTLRPCSLGESSLSIGRVNPLVLTVAKSDRAILMTSYRQKHN